MAIYGYRYGPQVLVRYPVKASSTIDMFDAVVVDASGDVSAAAAGANIDTFCGWAIGEVTTAPTNDGDVSILVDVSTLSVYEIPPDAGTVTGALRYKTCDLGGAQSANIDASADDCLLIQNVDTDANTCFVSRVSGPGGVA